MYLMNEGKQGNITTEEKTNETEIKTEAKTNEELLEEIKKLREETEKDNKKKHENSAFNTMMIVGLILLAFVLFVKCLM